MTTLKFRRLNRPLGALALLAATLVGSPAAAAGQASASVEARYQRELAACAAPTYVGDRQACRRDAGAGRSQSTASPADADPGRYVRNALKRCELLPEADRSDCVLRMQGLGTTQGSAADGGIYRELVTRRVGVPAAAASTAGK